MKDYEYFQVSDDSGVPKYKQIVQSIQMAVDSGRLTHGMLLPSMNAIRDELKVSRDTVFKAYNELKTRGIISSNPGKGYFISANKSDIKKNVFLLLDNFTAYKEVLYNAFRATLGSDAVIDLYFHHFKSDVFQSLVSAAAGKYTDYVIMPLEDQQHLEFLQRTIDTQRLYILDTGWKMFGQVFPSVCQNFANEMYISLTHAQNKLEKYSKIMVIWGEAESVYQCNISNDIIQGVELYCKKNEISFERQESADNLQPKAGYCYIISYDFDLVALVTKAEQQGLELGKDVGIISFNESPLMEIAGGGIATISADFKVMGQTIAEMVSQNNKEHIVTPFSFIKRGSV